MMSCHQMIGFSIIWTNKRQAQIHFVSSLVRVVCRFVFLYQLLSQCSSALGGSPAWLWCPGGFSCMLWRPKGALVHALAPGGALLHALAPWVAPLPSSGALQLFNISPLFNNQLEDDPYEEAKSSWIIC